MFCFVLFLLLSRLQFLSHWKFLFLSWKKRKRVSSHSCVILMIPWTLPCQSPLSIRFSNKEYWSRLHFLLQGNFPNLEFNPDLQNCRQMLYRLSFAGSPYVWKSVHKFSYVKYWDFIFHWRKSILKYERCKILYFMLKNIHSNFHDWDRRNYISHQNIFSWMKQKIPFVLIGQLIEVFSNVT